MKQLIRPILIILVMIVIAVGAGVIIAISVSKGLEEKQVPMTTLEVSGLKTSVTSSTDGTKHNVTMNLYFELSNELVSMIGIKSMKKELSKMISTLDYDRLTAADNVAYVKDYIVSQFSDEIDKSEIGNVYVTDIVTGPLKFYSPDAEEDAPPPVTMDIKTQQKFNGLFKGVE